MASATLCLLSRSHSGKRYGVLTLIDAIVVGAGPAGNNAALGLARRGYEVMVIDAKETIGDKLCTGIVGQECLQTYPIRPGLIHREAVSANVITPSGNSACFRADSPQAFVIDRVAYVKSFACRAQAAGARYLKGQRVISVQTNVDGVVVQTEHARYRSRCLVVASGFRSPLVRQLGLDSVADFVTGVQVPVYTTYVNQIEVHLGSSVAPGAFAWLAPTTPNRALVGLLSRRNFHQLLNQFIQRMQESGKVGGLVEGVKIWGIPLRPLKRTYLDRVLVVGDAAGQVKPTTGGGIYYSLLSSEIAADVLAQALGEDDLSAVRLSHYQRRWRALLSLELEAGYSARRLYEALSDGQINYLVKQARRHNLCAKLVNSSDGAFDWHSKIVRSLMCHSVFSKVLSLISPLPGGLAHSADGPPNREWRAPALPTS